MSILSERLESIKLAENCGDICNITRGLEKESLRVSAEGRLADSPHPKALGSALTHPRITTDYSEALLEFITPPSSEHQQLLKTLADLHSFTYQHTDNESLWVNSMPCMLSQDSEIPLAQYGTSNSALMKTIYRKGLGYRYGRAMQTIAGIHYNFSLSERFWQFLRQQDRSALSLQEYKNQGYFRLIRNFRRYFWLLLYLFGAAPAVCRSFVKHRQHQLIPVGEDQHSLHMPYATSLRMGDLGYQSSAQQSLVLTYNCLDSYVNSLCQAITQPHPTYEAIGIKDEQGYYKQLNCNLLQIENEFYSVIRPKRAVRRGQTALNALTGGGVEYIEVRCLDLNPFEPVGISQQQIQFLDVFLIYCLLEDSPFSDYEEYYQIQENQRRIVYQGRDPRLTLFHRGKERSARQWGHELMQALGTVAKLLDDAGTGNYLAVVNTEANKLVSERLTPSARILEEMQAQEITFYRWAMNTSLANREYFKEHTLKPERLELYNTMAAESWREQNELERQDQLSLEEFLANYYKQYQCSPEPQLANSIPI